MSDVSTWSDSTHFIMMKQEPMTRHEYRGSFHGPRSVFRGGGRRGGRRAFIVQHAKAINSAFIPAMMRIASRKSAVSPLPESRWVTLDSLRSSISRLIMIG